MLYILSFLHQTATVGGVSNSQHRCISYLSYIKPQPFHVITFSSTSCISYLSYIKPQLYPDAVNSSKVVYLIFPTSNRNIIFNLKWMDALYILSFLHQTATREISSCYPIGCISYLSYIKPQLRW